MTLLGSPVFTSFTILLPLCLVQLKSAREALDKQLSLSQAEARSLARQLRETSQQLSLLQEDHAAAEAVLARLKDERQQLLVVSQATAAVCLLLLYRAVA